MTVKDLLYNQLEVTNYKGATYFDLISTIKFNNQFMKYRLVQVKRDITDKFGKNFSIVWGYGMVSTYYKKNLEKSL